MKTSLELSKKLAENGCELSSDRVYLEGRNDGQDFLMVRHEKRNFDTGSMEMKWFDDRGLGNFGEDMIKGDMHKAYSYDILNDICVKYAKEFFGERGFPTLVIFFSARRGNREEAEEVIRELCLFNPKNKGEE